jgi:hypothetical protein
MNGSKLTSILIKRIETAYKGYAVNTIIVNKAGTPDILACIDGKFFGFEVKGYRDKERPLQSHKLDMIGKAGGYSGYVRSVADMDYIIKNNIRYKKSNDTEKISL